MPVATETRGQLVIIGGAEDKQGDCKILREFVRCSGGLQAQIVVMTVATNLPGEVGSDYIDVFKRLGVEDVRVIDTARREDASEAKALEAITNATGVFFTGGDQSRITSVLKGTELDAALHKRYAEGIVVGGTSAGASMMSETMIVDGDAETHPRMDIVEIDSGMSFMPDALIDQHFAQRGRLGRLISGVAKEPQLLGIGIDENTAIIVDNHQFSVIGAGAVTIVDLSEVTHTNLDSLLKDEGLAVCGAKLHILPDGYRFDMQTRQPIVNP